MVYLRKIVADIISLQIIISLIHRIQNSEIYDTILTLITNIGLLLIYPKTYKNIKQNKKYSQKYVNNRCFILGNGPSLNDIDFVNLSNETVFTVNYLFYHKNFKDLKSNFHLFMDIAIFGEGFGKEGKFQQDIQDEMNFLAESGVKNLILPALSSERYVKMYKLDDKFNIIYLFSKPESSGNTKINCDITKPIVALNNVVQFAIIVAIYMGFKEIYLLGCDATMILDAFNELLGENRQISHCYQTLDKENDMARKLATDSNHIITGFTNYLKYIKSFKHINEYCQKNKISIINLSSKSLVPFISRKSIEDIIKEG